MSKIKKGTALLGKNVEMKYDKGLVFKKPTSTYTNKMESPVNKETKFTSTQCDKNRD